MYGDTSHLDEVKKKLDAVSPTFCMAKWKHTTIHLLNGTTHSCYLPPVHPIPLDEIAKDPSALHNTSHKKQQRKQMLEGKRPKECSMCWAIEDLPQGHVSDRILRGSESWTTPYFDEVKRLPWDGNILPSYLEVSFSSICNLKCSYCSPHVSTKWHEEIKQHGPYQLTYPYQDTKGLAKAGLMPIEDEDNNPYIDAFWKWWPELYSRLKVFRITGGEPLLSKHTFKVLDWIEQNPNKDLELDINSNLSVPDGVFDRFIERVELISKASKLRRFSIHTSLDSFGNQAEYIRNGLNFEKFQKNVYQFLERVPNGDLSFMSTFNALSVTNYKPFLDWMIELRSKYQKNQRWVNFDIPHLTGPRHQSVRVLTEDFHHKVFNLISYLESNVSDQRGDAAFRPMEVEKMKRIYDWMTTPQDQKELIEARKDFYLFFNEHDRRRKTNFLATFPEMKEFYGLCQGLTR